jgi:hypothetical protein
VKRHTRLAIIPILLLTIAAATVSAQRVEIRLRGHYFAEPATVRLTVAIEPDAANRVLRVEADGELMFQSSEVSLGDGSQRLYTLEFKNLAAGAYTLRAEVRSRTGVVAQAEQELIVAGT